MENNFCTLFNYNYLSRGLALYESLVKTNECFSLFIFAFDEKTFTHLKNKNLEFCEIISLQEFEDDELLKVKPGRTFAEYCWTCTPSVVKYTIEKFELDSCTYIDADIYFYSSPRNIFKELVNSSIGLTPHYYSKEFDLAGISGKYCVQFVFFRNDTNGMKALQWWRGKCIDWCFSRIEKNRFGDQKYLDFFNQLFDGVHDIENPGSGIAPWNILNHGFSSENNQVYVSDKNGEKSPLVFYHFHKVNIGYKEKIIYLKKYFYSSNALELIYKPYLKELIRLDNSIMSTDFKLEDFKIKYASMLQVTIFRFIRIAGNNLFFRKIYNYLIWFMNKKASL